MSKLKWDYFPVEENQPEFWNAALPDLNLHIEVYRAPMSGFRYALSNGGHTPVFAGVQREATLEEAQAIAIAKTADYFEALSRRLRNKG